MNSRAMTVFERQQHSTWNVCRPAFSRDAESESKFINSLQILHPFNFLHQKIYSAHLSNSSKLMRVNPEAKFTKWSIQEEFEDKCEANLHGYILIVAVLCAVLSPQQFMPKFVLSKTAKLLRSTLCIFSGLRTQTLTHPCKQSFILTHVAIWDNQPLLTN